jgi:hypothetical protein
MSEQSFISGIIENFKEGQEEARRERKARQKEYKRRLIENFNYSPKEFYVLLAKALDARTVPGLSAGLVKLYESVQGSPKRLYMTVDRERFVYYVCAAPDGTWIHFFVLLAALGCSTLLLSWLSISTIIDLLASLGFDSISLAVIIPSIPATFFIFQFLFLWSLMRCAAIPGYEVLATSIERTPLVGRVFERFFRPDTYYRHDSEEMFKQAFDNAISETIEFVTNPQGARKRDFGDAPVVSNLHGK